MPNFAPIFTKVARAAWATLTAANTAKDGTGTTALVMTADATEGGNLGAIVCEPLGTNVATVLRVFLNNGSTPGTAANNTLIGQIALPATTLSETSTATMQAVERIFNRPIPPGYRVYACLATAVAAGWQITTVSGDY